jgi:CHAD domain-containing protein
MSKTPRRQTTRRNVLAATGPVVVAGGALAAKALVDRTAERSASARARYRIETDEKPGPAIRRIAGGQLDRVIEELRSDGGSDAIHEARKALKRSRTLLRVARGMIGEDVYRRENAELRSAGRTLSPIRDADALAETLQSLGHGDVAQRISPPPDDGPNPKTEAAVLEATAIVAASRMRVPTWPLPAEAGEGQLAGGLNRIYRRGRRALARVRKKGEDERWHDLRKRSKDLWYAARLLERSCPDRMGKLAKRARRLSKLLGEDHDLAVLQEKLREEGVASQADDEQLSRAIAARRETLQRDALRLAKRLYRRKPRKLIRRLGLA